MDVRRCSLALVLLLLPAQTRAHLHKASTRAGYSAVGGSLLSGFEVSAELMVRKSNPTSRETILTRWDSYFVDFSANWGSHEDVDRRQLAIVVGPRATKYVGTSFELFAQVATGAVQTKDSPGTSDWAWGVGGGSGFAFALLDRHTHPERGLDLWVRAQYLYLRLSESETDARNYHRGSIGVEFRFGGKGK
jgi:hypothetical protein